MPRKNMIPHTVHLFNYVGEVNDVAKYQEVVIKRCYCNISEGVGTSSSGKKTNDAVKLYIFKRDSIVLSSAGSPVRYIPIDKWEELKAKTGYWTINPNDKDYFVLDGRKERFKVKSVADNEVGSHRMWHYEVSGK